MQRLGWAGSQPYINRYFMSYIRPILKNIIPVLVFSFSTFAGLAQLKVGIKMGGNFSNVKSDPDHQFTKQPGFQAGLMGQYTHNKKYFLQTELLVCQKGYTGLLIPTGTTKNNLYYLTVPLLAGFHPIPALNILVGSAFNYLIGADFKNANGKSNSLDSYNKTDIDLVAACGYNISRKINFELRYNYGLNKIRKQSDIFGTQYNRNIQINLAYIF